MNTIRNPEREKRWADIKAGESLFDDICVHVASGGSIETLAELWDIPGGWIMSYMVETPEKKVRFDASVSARDVWVNESLTRQATAIATADIRGILDEDGIPVPKTKWPADVAKAIQSIEVSVDKDGNPAYKIKFYDKLRAIEMVGRRAGTFQPTVDVKVSGSLDLASLVKESLSETGSGTSKDLA